jgi:hypothetical protein
VGNLSEKCPPVTIGLYAKDNIKIMFFKKYYFGEVVGCCEHGNVKCDSIKNENILAS